ncbi:uncharacterized protein LOC126906355 [Daktulosphaira vitifoliae]|uniref:uncharacterized protein LOC126906355 n=1 Tax=Daktulosphaira vitifoliae TaxID=58002 RepID=UPI0021AAE6DB|nr:uncharacterized protein LOC126906355 [Daktulosphaira vitifoliae]
MSTDAARGTGNVSQLLYKLLRITFYLLAFCEYTIAEECGANGQQLKYLWGDAFTDSLDCIGPNGKPYPESVVAGTFRRTSSWSSSRTGRDAFHSYHKPSPETVRETLLKNYKSNNHQEDITISRTARDYGSTLASGRDRELCQTPNRLCRTRYNTTAPMYGVSLTSGQPVTIVQKFPDLLQQVVYEVCESNECDVVRGECTQTYVPYLFLVIPLGPVTLTGQDYVLVESGCVCKPKGSRTTAHELVSTIPAIPGRKDH